jgi:NitT/TauT family transport system substrate-binding protein
MHAPSRAQWLAGSAALLAAGRATVVRAQPLLTVRYGSTPLVDGVPIYYAQQTGLFKAAGLDVGITKLTSTSAIAAALVGGALDVGEVSAIPLINAHVRGVPIKVVYANVMHINGRPFYSAILVPADSTVKTGKDLNGKTMSSAAVGDTAWMAARVWVDANGGDSSTVKFVEIPFSAVPAAIEEHRVDAAVTAEPYFSQAINGGKARTLADVAAGFGARCVQTTYAALSDYITKNRDAMGRFARVMHQAHDYLNNHRDDLATYTEQFTLVPKAQQRPETVAFAVDAGPRDVQPWIVAAARYGTIPKSFDAAELFVNPPLA